MDEIQQYSKIRADIEKATIQERPLIDDKLAVIQKIAKKLGADLEVQNKIAVARIDNMRKLGNQLDEARAAGLIVRRSTKNTVSSVLGTLEKPSELVRYADELKKWPEEEYERFIKAHGYERDNR